MGFLSFKTFKIFLLILAILGVEGYFIAAVPTTSAFHNPPNAGGCANVVLVSTTENPSCDASSQVNPSMTSYSATYHIQSLKSNDYTLKWNKESWYCTDPFPHDGSDQSRLACRKAPVTAAGSVPLAASSAVDITIPGHFDQPACGSLQTDLSFDVVDKNNNVVCSYGNPNFVFGFSFCSTGKTCGAPTPTSKPSPTPTSKPSPTPTSKPSATPTPKPSASPTPTTSVTPSQSPTPTPTGAPTGTPTPTPTGAPTATPTSGPTATPAPTTEVTATPTPGQNIIVNVSQSQQQQQVLAAATVAPAPTTTQLPSTGAGSDILLAFGTLIPLGLKLRKMK